MQHMRLCLDYFLFKHGITADLNCITRLKVGNIVCGGDYSTNVLFVDPLTQQSRKAVRGKLVGLVVDLVNIAKVLKKDVFGVPKFTC